MKLQPLGARVIIRRDEVKTTTASGIILPGKAAEVPRRGKVIAVGPSVSRRPGVTLGRSGDPWLKEGDVVLFSAFAGADIQIGDGPSADKVIIMTEEDVLAIVTEEPAKDDFDMAAGDVSKFKPVVKKGK